MNTGIISIRYARAFLKYVNIQGDADATYNDVVRLRNALTTSSCYEALKSSVSLDSLSPSLIRFLEFVFSKGRGELLKFILHDFEELYLEDRKIIQAKLFTSVASEKLENFLKNTIKSSTGCQLQLETVIEPDLIGGFTFSIKDIRVDASVKGQIETLRKQFISKNKRIV